MVEDPSVAAAEEAALAAKNDMIVSDSGTSSSTPGVGVGVAGAAGRPCCCCYWCC